jgi:hypothetical protein
MMRMMLTPGVFLVFTSEMTSVTPADSISPRSVTSSEKSSRSTSCRTML